MADDRSDAQRQERLEALWDAARGLPEAERRAYLDRAIPDDPALRSELESLLAHADRAEALFDQLSAAAGRGAQDAMTRSLLDEIQAGLAGRYALERELGHGGMATVFLARDLRHDRAVAIKVLAPELAALVGPRRFEREIRLAAQLTHPHILPLLDSGEIAIAGGADRHMWYSMPWVAGDSLRHRLAREGQLPVTEAVRIAGEVADALDYAHRQGFVHRDIKPENILLQDGHALVADFGIARAIDAVGESQLTSSGMIPGTPAYMSPEQASGSHVDGRTDLYSLGCVLYEMLTGSPPFAGPNVAAIVAQVMTGEPRPVTATRPTAAALEPVLARALARMPADRFATGHEFAAALAATTTTEQAPRPAVRRRRVVRTGVSVAGLLMVAAAAVLVWRASRAGSGLDRDRVIVLPFTNQTGDAALGPFGAMLAAMISDRLTGMQMATVAPPPDLVRPGAATSGATLDYRTLARNAGAGLIVHGDYFLRSDSLVIQPRIIDGEENRQLSPMLAVVMPVAHQEEGVRQVLGRVLVALSSRADPLQARAIAQFDLPMTWEAYREYAAGVSQSWAGNLEAALAHFLRSIELDPDAATPRLWAVYRGWDLYANLPWVDSMLQTVERLRGDLAPINRANLDRLTAWVRGDLQGALAATRQMVDFGGPRNAHAQEALRLNQVELARAQAEASLERTLGGRGPFTFTLLTSVEHAGGRHRRELRLAEQSTAETGAEPANLMMQVRALAASGRVAQLRDRLEQLRQADPGSLGFRVAAYELRFHGDTAAAREVGLRAVNWYREELARSPSRPVRHHLAGTLFDLLQWIEARALFQQLAAEPLPDTYGRDHFRGLDVEPLGYLGLIAAIQGDTVTARAMADSLGRVEREYLFGKPAHWQALIAAQLGDCNRAVERLEAALAGGSPYFSENGAYWIAKQEIVQLAGLRDCARYSAFMEPR